MTKMMYDLLVRKQIERYVQLFFRSSHHHYKKAPSAKGAILKRSGDPIAKLHRRALSTKSPGQCFHKPGRMI